MSGATKCRVYGQQLRVTSIVVHLDARKLAGGKGYVVHLCSTSPCCCESTATTLNVPSILLSSLAGMVNDLINSDKFVHPAKIKLGSQLL